MAQDYGLGHGGEYEPTALTLPISPPYVPNMPAETAYGIRVAAGVVPGQTHINKFGQNPDVDTGSAPEDVWDFGGLYTFSSGNDIDTLSSSDNGDTQVLEIQGLTSDGTLVTQTKALTGQAQTTLDTPLWRVFRMKNTGSADIAGIAYLYEAGTASLGVPDIAADVRAIISGDNNQTLMAIYTVPKNKIAYLRQFYISSSRSVGGIGVGDLTLRVRESGGVFQVKHTMSFSAASGVSVIKFFETPDPVPEMSDILVRVESTSDNDTLVNAGFELILVDV